MPVPDLRSLCTELALTGPNPICISLPGGTDLCLQLPDLVPPSPDEAIRALFAQLNAALAPLTPIFNIIDAVVAVFDCVKAISTLDPVEIVNCIPNLADKVAALLRLIPLLTLPVLIVQFLDILILYLRGQRNQAARQLLYIQRILAAELASTRPGNVGLARVIDCAKADLRQMVQWFNEQNKPVNRLIGIINFFLEVVGLGKYQIPDLSEIDPDRLEDALTLYDLAIELLEGLRLVIAPLAGEITAPFEAAAQEVEEG